MLQGLQFLMQIQIAGAADFFAGIGIPWARTPVDRRRGDGTACCG